MQVEFNCQASSDSFKLGHFRRVSLSFKVLTVWKRLALAFCGMTLSLDVADVSQQPHWDRASSAGAPLKGWLVCPKCIESGAVAVRWLRVSTNLSTHSTGSCCPLPGFPPYPYHFPLLLMSILWEGFWNYTSILITHETSTASLGLLPKSAAPMTMPSSDSVSIIPWHIPVDSLL